MAAANQSASSTSHPSRASNASHFCASSHQSFHWIDGPSKDSVYANFVEMTYDLAAGINLCLEIAHASELQREINQNADESERVTPAVGAFDAEKLLRMAIVSSALLKQEAWHRIDAANAAGPA